MKDLLMILNLFVGALARPVNICIGVVNLVADLPMSLQVIDVMKHQDSAPCTVCTFRHCQNYEQTRYVYDNEFSIFITNECNQSLEYCYDVTI